MIEVLVPTAHAKTFVPLLLAPEGHAFSFSRLAVSATRRPTEKRLRKGCQLVTSPLVLEVTQWSTFSEVQMDVLPSAYGEIRTLASILQGVWGDGGVGGVAEVQRVTVLVKVCYWLLISQVFACAVSLCRLPICVLKWCSMLFHCT